MEADELTEQEEQAAVFRHRYRQARQAGLDPEQALAFATTDTDIGQLRQLAAAGCPPETISRIVT